MKSKREKTAQGISRPNYEVQFAAQAGKCQIRCYYVCKMWLVLLSCTTYTYVTGAEKMMNQWVVMAIHGGRFDRAPAKYLPRQSLLIAVLRYEQGGGGDATPCKVVL